MNICYVLEVIMDVMAIFLIIFMVYSIKAKERAEEEEAKRVMDYNFAYGQYKTMEQVYKHEAEEYRHWLHFGLKYGCRSPEEMRMLIDDLVKKINKMEAK